MVPSVSYKEGSAKYMVVSFATPVYVVTIANIVRCSSGVPSFLNSSKRDAPSFYLIRQYPYATRSVK